MTLRKIRELAEREKEHIKKLTISYTEHEISAMCDGIDWLLEVIQISMENGE